MEGKYPIAETASLFADPARVAILVALLDGRSLPASELAFRARVSAQAASMHLGKLLGGRLVTVSRFGRHRYYSLAGPDVAAALEAMGTLCNAIRPLPPPADGSIVPIRMARTCYDHLAGKVGVQICDSLQERKLLAPVDDTPTVSDPLCASASIGPNVNSMSPEPPERLCLIFSASGSGSSKKLVLAS